MTQSYEKSAVAQTFLNIRRQTVYAYAFGAVAAGVPSGPTGDLLSRL